MREFFTYADAVEHLVDYLGGNPGTAVVKDAKRAIQSAYRELANAHLWTYLFTMGRVQARAPYVTGTVVYTHEGATYPRQVDLTDGVWPTWSNLATIRIDYTDYRVAERKSDTVLTLTALNNPGMDLPSQSYRLYIDQITLPPDFIAQDEAMYNRHAFAGMNYVHPREWLVDHRLNFTYGVPAVYTIMPDSGITGRFALSIYPVPAQDRPIEFLYKRRPSDLIIHEITSPTIFASTTAGSKTVTFTGAAMLPTMIGSSLRLSSTTSKPTSRVNENPCADESMIASVDTPMTCTLSDEADMTLTGVAWVVSDRVDVELGAMLTAFLRGCEAQIGMSRILKDKPSARLQYQQALAEAKEADSRSFAGRSERPPYSRRPMLRELPETPPVIYGP